MIDSSGHLIHIDFGFVFGLAPGKQFSMETAPWKLTEEMVEVRRFSFTESSSSCSSLSFKVMGGWDSPYFQLYANLTTEAFRAVRRHTDDICKLMEIMSHMSCYPAFKSVCCITNISFSHYPFFHSLLFQI
jgi:phosphatidylinositol kinase/protein kinase (PI-3  family)